MLDRRRMARHMAITITLASEFALAVSSSVMPGRTTDAR